MDQAKVFYDSNATDHHHVYDVDRATLTDIDADEDSVNGRRTPIVAVIRCHGSVGGSARPDILEPVHSRAGFRLRPSRQVSDSVLSLAGATKGVESRSTHNSIRAIGTFGWGGVTDRSAYVLYELR